MKMFAVITILLSVAFAIALPLGYEPSKILTVLIVTAFSTSPFTYFMIFLYNKSSGTKYGLKMLYCIVFAILFSVGLQYCMRPHMQFHNCLILLAMILVAYEVISFTLVLDTKKT